MPNLRGRSIKRHRAKNPEPIPQLIKVSAARGLRDLPGIVTGVIFEARSAEARGRALRKLDFTPDRRVTDRSN